MFLVQSITLKIPYLLHRFADVLVYVYNISSFFYFVVQYFSINLLAILKYISKARYFLSGHSPERLITSLYKIQFDFKCFGHVLLIVSWILTTFLNRPYIVHISLSNILKITFWVIWSFFLWNHYKMVLRGT